MRITTRGTTAGSKGRYRVASMLLGAVFGLSAALTLSIAEPALAQGKSDEAQKNRKWNLRREERLNDYRDERGRVRPDLWKQGVEHFQQMEFFSGFPIFFMKAGVLIAKGNNSGKSVQKIKMVLGTQQGLGLMLAVNVHQQGGYFTQQ